MKAARGVQFKISKKSGTLNFESTSHFHFISIPTMAEEGNVVALVGVNAKPAAEDCIKAKEMLAAADLPQDYSSSSNISPAKPVVSSVTTETSRAWVSPNKSDEVEPSSEESSSTCEDGKLNAKVLLAESGINANNLDAEYDGDFETTESDPDLSIIGQRLEVQNLGSSSNTEAVLDATGKGFVRIVHGEKAVMMILPSDVSNFQVCHFRSLHLSHSLRHSFL